ncbi:N-acetylglucosamine-6-phosphate deacetylase [Alteribacter populi]|uniref:N-acetylglucosamine-6-phosphate deacetylase n=1 Tax=Alteribacter populi TaxID=2011011 RepID=UPI000BBA6E27|nr:N-acetylglucosamine-6-phosphate deacetylase [Alteribacter populi]
MKKVLYKGCTLYAKEETIQDPVVEVENQRFVSVRQSDGLTEEDWEVIEFPKGTLIVPGFIDIHIHGAYIADVMDAKKSTFPTMVRHLPKEGTTAFLATTITQEVAEKQKALENVAAYMEAPSEAGAELLGVHLEGPFISAKRAGAQPLEHIYKPDVTVFQQFEKAANNQIKLVTLAPEEGMELVDYLHSKNIIPSIGHSDALHAQVIEAIDHGVCHATHLFNGMRGIHHRDSGVAGSVFLYDELKAELVVDGIHVSPEMVKMTYKNKGEDGIILITDAMRAKGLGDGTYDLGGQDVTVKGERAELSNGTLAGSVLKMNEAVRNMVQFSGCSLYEAVKMASLNPAKQLGIDDRKGSIEVGKDADFTILNENFEIFETYCKGQSVYSNSEEE